MTKPSGRKRTSKAKGVDIDSFCAWDVSVQATHLDATGEVGHGS
jgi:hypothetical protein